MQSPYSFSISLRMENRIDASLEQLLLPENGEIPIVHRYEGLRDGGGHEVEKEALRLKDVRSERCGNGINITFERDGGQLEADATHLKFPNSWETVLSLHAVVVNGSQPIIFEMSTLGARGRFIERKELAPGERAEIRLDLPDLPLGQASQPAWQSGFIRFMAQWGQSWPTEGALCEVEGAWGPTMGNQAASVEIRELWLECGEAGSQLPIVDRFGQRVHAEWSGKIRSEQDLQRNREQEVLQEPAIPKEQLTRFGGDKHLPRHVASGFFRVEQDPDGRWWFIDPEGYRFWSIGTTGVRLMDSTIVEGRESFFEALPEARGAYASVVNPEINSPANDPKGRKAVAFYGWNVLRKYGSPYVWRDQVISRFQSWGFNTLGNWSELKYFADGGFPFTVSLSTRRPGFPRLKGNLPDLDAPGWEAAFTEHVEETMAPLRSNPFVLGMFVDNEMGWRGLSGDQLDSYSEQYFSQVSSILKKHAPNHLYLGCRFVRRMPDAIVAKNAGRYCDVVTVNSYDLWPREPEFREWYKHAQRPILIGEHHTPLHCTRQAPPLYAAFTEEERERLYQELVEKWARQPWAVGCHWYQHADQHPTGRPLDGENQPVGFVDITDTPHPDMVAAARAATPNTRKWHMAAPNCPRVT